MPKKKGKSRPPKRYCAECGKPIGGNRSPNALYPDLCGACEKEQRLIDGARCAVCGEPIRGTAASGLCAPSISRCSFSQAPHKSG